MATRAVINARIALWQAIDAACIARGEAQWMNGYRAGRISCTAVTLSEDQSLYEKEMARWKACEPAERRADQALARYVRIRRQSKGSR